MKFNFFILNFNYILNKKDFLGKCVANNEDQKAIKDSLRSETETYIDQELDKAPIRIHKYSLDNDDYKDLYSDDYENKINIQNNWDNSQGNLINQS
jgi:hypothetical protein